VAPIGEERHSGALQDVLEHAFLVMVLLLSIGGF
jgi:hypothetical protein